MTSKDIEKCLAKRHLENLFFTQIKNGPTWHSKNLAIMDAWGMQPSWTKPEFTGYEIKVSRSDFIQDTKFVNYLELCQYFYFVSPKEIIKESELPEQAGLMVCYPSGHLKILKKAPFRNIYPPSEFFLYLFMNKITKNWERGTRIEYWKGILGQLEVASQTGKDISRLLIFIKNQQLVKELELLEKRRFELKRDFEILEELKKHFEVNSLWALKQKIESQLNYPKQDLDHCLDKLKEVQNTLIRLKG